MNKLWLVNKIQNCNKTKIRTFKKKNNNKTDHFRLPKLECLQPDPANCRFAEAETYNIPRKLKQNIFSEIKICQNDFLNYCQVYVCYLKFFGEIVFY